MNDKSKILVTDDDPEMRSFFRILLSPHFDVSLAEDGKQALEMLSSQKFLFVVLDFHMPKLTGIEVCEAISELDEKQRPSVVMVSGDSSDDVVCKAYDLGVDDYIVKPFCSIAFMQRLQRLERDITERHRWHDEQNRSQTLVNSAMEQASHYGSAFELISRLNLANELADVAHEVLHYFQHQGFFAAVQLRTDSDEVSVDIDSDTCSAVELKVFKLLHDKGRIYNFGQRSIFNDENVSLLIKNMPENTTTAYGFLVDIAAKLLPAINNRVMAISNEQIIKTAVSSLSDAIQKISRGITRMETEKQELLDRVSTEINLSFHHLELTEEQEAFFVNLVEKQLKKQNTQDDFVAVDDLIKNSLEKIEKTQRMAQTAPKEQVQCNSVETVEFF